MKQLASLQALRAVAALMVVFFHLSIALMNDYHVTSFDIFPTGSNGVDIFFVLSGFIMCYTTERLDQRSGVEFAVKRLVRILPLYWGLTILLYLIASFAPTLLGSTQASPEALWKSLAFIPYVTPADGKVHPLLILGWTLNYEMFFYAVFTVCLLLVPRRRITAVIAVLLVCRLAGFLVDWKQPEIAFYTGRLYGTQLEFVWGCLVFVLFQYRPQWVKAMAPLGLVGFALILAQNWFPNITITREFKVGLPAALVVIGTLGWEMKTGRIRDFMVRLGDASYSLYLGHPYVVEVVTRLAIVALGASVAGAIVGVTATIVITAILSLLSFRLFEKPTNDWLRNRILGRKPKAPAVGASQSA